jgi:hypothetical protein
MHTLNVCTVNRMQTLSMVDAARCGCCPVYPSSSASSVAHLLSGRWEGRTGERQILSHALPGEIASTPAGANSRFGLSVAAQITVWEIPSKQWFRAGILCSVEGGKHKDVAVPLSRLSHCVLLPSSFHVTLMWSAALSSKGTMSREQCQRQSALEQGCEWQCWLALVDVARALGVESGGQLVRSQANSEAVRARGSPFTIHESSHSQHPSLATAC